MAQPDRRAYYRARHARLKADPEYVQMKRDASRKHRLKRKASETPEEKRARRKREAVWRKARRAAEIMGKPAKEIRELWGV